MNFFKNYYETIGLQILSVLFAFFIWLYVISSAPVVEIINYNINYQLPKGYAISNLPPNSVRLTFKGPRAQVKNLEVGKKTIVVDIRRIFSKNKSKYELQVSKLPFTVPFGVNLESASLDTLEVKIGRSQTKVVPIKPMIVGKINSDYKVTSIKTLPNSIRIEGSRDSLDRVDNVSTLPLNVADLSESKSLITKLNLDKNRYQFSDKDVSVDISLSPLRSNMLLRDIPILFTTPFKIKSSSASKVNLVVLVEGDEAEDKISDVRVIAEILSKDDVDKEIELKASLPEGIHLLKIIPKTIKVKVNK